MSQTSSARPLQITAALAALVGGAAVIATAAMAGPAPNPGAGFEKCAAIAKAHMNDCASKMHSCAGQSTKDRDADSWVYVPTGTCGKIAGGVVVQK